MIKPEQIPDAAVTEAAIERWGVNEPTKWELDTCRIIIAAALSAWTGAAVCHYTIGDDEGYEMVLPLPFPQEKLDAEA